MGLEAYWNKRNFRNTPEPKGQPGKETRQLKFVIQKHHASHLHYDFRLELDGVLKSWAVPKGPSVRPSDKRLAMMVEDHPMSYREFEGIIPPGNYGAGTVMVWDEGFYTAREGSTFKEQLAYLHKGLQKGHISFILSGNKLRGEFSLIKIPSRGENAWLLVKKDDEYGADIDIVKEADRSVKTERTLDEIREAAKEEGNVWQSNRASTGKEKAEKIISNALPEIQLPKGAVKKKLTDLPEPMKATLASEAFDNHDWIFELKWDGFRAVAARLGKVNEIYSRNFKSFNGRFPDIHQAFKNLFTKDIILDGEICCIDDEGKSSFQLLQQYQTTGKGRLVFYVFDILYYDGNHLFNVPLLERKALLKSILPEDEFIHFSDHVETRGKELFEFAASKKQEGIIAKKKDSKYEVGKRSKSWLKIKAVMQQEAIICGYTLPRGGRKHFGSLILGVYDGKELRYIGHTGTGFNDALLKELKRRMDDLKTSSSPFKKAPKTNEPVTWIKPQLIAEIKFQEWTSDNILRHPVFLGLRDDKKSKEIKKEMPSEDVIPGEKKSEKAATKKTTRTRKTTNIKASKGKHKSIKESSLSIEDGKDQLIKTRHGNLKLTNLSKLYWKKEKITKLELIRYYDEISPFILPFLKDRPQSLKRHPNGIDGSFFFQKDVKGKVPEWIETYDDHSGSSGKVIQYMLCQDKAALMYMANLGCIEINPWHSTVHKPDHPDYIIIDLDPLEISFEKVIEAANRIHVILDAADIPSYPKTSGSRGIHIFIPFNGKYTYEQGKNFAELIATLAHNQMPSFTSIERSPSKRKGKLYLDYLQNNPAQTIAAPYCLRPKPHAPVSTPLHWDEVKKGLKPDTYTISNIFDRLRDVGEIFYPVLGKGIDIEKSLNRLI